MNFQLSPCGMPGVVLQFQDIDPDLLVDDFVAYIVHRLRHALHGAELRRFQRIVNKTVVLLSRDGSVRRLLCDSSTGRQGSKHSANNAPRFEICADAFDFLDDGSNDGDRGFLYFGFQTQTINCALKFRDRLCGHTSRTALQHGGKNNAFVIRATDLIFGDILDVKNVLAESTSLHVDELAVLEEFSDIELGDATLLFPYLCETGEAQLRVVEREGLSVFVHIQSRVLTLPRFGTGATIAEVKERLQRSFGLCLDGGLYLRGCEDEGQLDDLEVLSALLNDHGEVHLVGVPDRRMAPVVRQHDPQIVDNFSRPVALRQAVAVPVEDSRTAVSRAVVPLDSDVTIRVHAEGFVGLEEDVFDVVLPNDGLPFTGSDLKDFIIKRDLIPRAQYRDLLLINGRREIGDNDELLLFLPRLDRPEASVTLLLTCRNRAQ